MPTPADFPEFFRTVNHGHDPFQWQIRLVDSILTRGSWPDRIGAPTGAGKSSVVEVHVFVNAVAAGDHTLRPPRRLIATVNRRALVDNQLDRANSIATLLAGATDGSLLAGMRAALRSLRSCPPRRIGDDLDPGIDVASLRGGVPTDPVWRDDPAACGVICATPDMWGSRALFRGYGSSRASRPRDAGPLVFDCALVLDEAHLNRQLLLTSRRISHLQRTAREELDVPVLQVVETTATPGSDRDSDGLTEVAVDGADLLIGGPDHALARRLTTAKPVRLVECAQWPATTTAARRAVAAEIAERALALRATRSRTVGVMVNTVDMAIAVTQELQHRNTAGGSVELIAGRMRPHDVATIRLGKRRNLFTVEGDPAVDVLVATQTLEVGIDIDLSALVTELAPGSAIAQRAGRVNRLGLSDDASVEVIVPPPRHRWDERHVRPYGSGDLEAACEWLRRREADPAGLAPWAIAADPGPVQSPGRQLFQRLEMADTWVLTDTSRPAFADPDLDLWLRDDLDDLNDGVSLVVRANLPTDDSVALDLLRATPPRDDECFPTRIRDAREVVDGILNGTSPRARCFRVRSGVVETCPTAQDIRAGDVLIVDDVHPVCRAGIVVREPVDRAMDVYESMADGRRPPTVRIVPGSDDENGVHRRILAAAERIIREAPKDTLGRRRSIADAIAAEQAEIISAVDGPGSASTPDRSEALRWAVDLLAGMKRWAEVLTGNPDENGAIPWMVIHDLRGGLDEELRQTWNRQGLPVTLDQHSDDVKERAQLVARQVGLGQGLRGALRLAGRHHDDGKADPRFQQMLQGTDTPVLEPGSLLAKSGARTAAQARAGTVRVNPTGWRHEHLSVVAAWSVVEEEPERDLILRLIGTSHGRGRGMFPHAAAKLLPVEPDHALRGVAEELFDAGRWDELMESTQTRWGPWGCAYLEAVLRAADCQVSEEGVP